MSKDDVLVPVPQIVGDVDQVGVLGHSDDVHDAVDAAERNTSVGEETLGVGAIGGVAGPGVTADLLGHVVGQVGVLVDAEDLGAY